MKKKLRSFLFGFTMAEILISITIAMIVATAMVPVLGTKKVKHPNNKIIHGYAACYYDINGRLRFEYRDNKTSNTSTAGQINGNHCTLQLPKSAYLNVIAIGAGGRSVPHSGWDNISISLPNATGWSDFNGVLRVDNNFQFDIDASESQDSALPGKIRMALQEWANRDPNYNQLFAEYRNVKSPIGAGGTGKCKVMTASSGGCGDPSPVTGGTGPNGSWYTQHTEPSTNTESRCWWYQHGAGSNSGMGTMKSSVRFPIDDTSAISVETSTTRTRVGVSSRRGNNYIELTSSGAGSPPTDMGSYYRNASGSGAAAQCYASNSSYCSGRTAVAENAGADGGNEYIYSKSCTDKVVPAKPGSLSYAHNDPISWRYRRPYLNVTFIGAGEFGNEVSQVFQNLKGTLDLFPALSSNSANSSRVLKDGKLIVEARSGNDSGARISKNNVKINETFPQDILSAAVKDNREKFKYITKLQAAGFQVPMLSCLDNESCPGFAGRGRYLKFLSTRGLETLTLTNNQSGSRPSYTLDYGADIPLTETYFGADDRYRQGLACLNGDPKFAVSAVNGVNVAEGCVGRNRNGGKGAIILIW